MPKEIYVFGSNREGQLGCAYPDDTACSPHLNEALTHEEISSVSLSAKQSQIITVGGVLYNSGENDQNELGRSGKRSVFNRVDALEAFSLVDIASGSGFVVASCVDGKVTAWGRNELGQLGNGTRDARTKPRFNNGLSHRILQVAAGADHVVALSTNGCVLTWGGNRKGQLGDGQFTSRNTPSVVPELRHRPVTSIACGEGHSMALTVGGAIYTWGDNSQGQLGLGDCKNRLRPEVVRSLKTAHCVHIAAGGQHSMAISHPLGLLFGFGSNSHGQLGQGQSQEATDTAYSSQDRTYASPTVVDSLRNEQVVDVACGRSHTLVVCRSKTASDSETHSTEVYAMGLNSSGQCGLGHFNNSYRPLRLSLDSDRPREAASDSPTQQSLVLHSVHTGPLAFHSMVCRYISSHGKPESDQDLLHLSRTLPAINCTVLEKAVNTWQQTQTPFALTFLRDLVAESFSSIAVLNASFRPVRRARDFLDASTKTVSRAAIDLDLNAVRKAYTLICSTNNDKVLSTLGRATLLVTDQLKECIFDSGENLSVFLIVLENPLLLKPEQFHVALQRLVSGILAIPKSFRVMFFGWLKRFPSEYFSRVVWVMQSYLTFILSHKAHNIDPTPVVLALESLFTCNQEAKIVPSHLFYNEFLSQSLDLQEEWSKYVSSDVSKVFNFFSYPFLFSVEAKNDLIRSHFSRQMQYQVSRHTSRYIAGSVSSSQSMPRGMAVQISPSQQIAVVLEIRVRRDFVLLDLQKNLREIIADDPTTLLLPLSVVFEEEVGIDQGGVAREMFAIALRDFVASRSDVLGICGDHEEQLWFRRQTGHPSPGEEFSAEYLLGVMIGLACYNGILVNLPIVPVVYKLWRNGKPSMEDLWAVDTFLARAMQLMLDADLDNTEFVDLFGVNFVASLNPILKASSSPTASSDSYVELRSNGHDVAVNKSNRKEFVESFLTHALYTSCKSAVDDFIDGLKIMLHTQSLELCTHNEVEHILCGYSYIGDLSQLRCRTTYLGDFSDSHPVIQYFWEAIGRFTVTERKRFLVFVTATDRIPVGGMERIGLTIQSTSQPPSALPAAHTCFNILDLPASYSSADEVYQQLTVSLQHCQGFGLA